jgi:hypothetical protein
VNGFLNQDCVLVQDFESIFPGGLFKIVFQQYRSWADICSRGLGVRFVPIADFRELICPEKREFVEQVTKALIEEGWKKVTEEKYSSTSSILLYGSGNREEAWAFRA